MNKLKLGYETTEYKMTRYLKYHFKIHIFTTIHLKSLALAANISIPFERHNPSHKKNWS